jgi:hypothetical protein
MQSGQYKSFGSAIFRSKLNLRPKLSDHEHVCPGRIAESDGFPIQSFIDP